MSVVATHGEIMGEKEKARLLLAEDMKATMRRRYGGCP
jgi:hypothetical protein